MNRVMKAILLAAAASALLLSGCGQKKEANDSGKLNVMASFYPMYDFAVKIGGDKVIVKNMVPAGTEPHDWEPATKDITGLEKADVFVYSGAGIEHWVEDVLKSLKNENLTVTEASSGISLLKGEEQEEAQSEEHEHGEFDPHVWLSPVNAKKEMENIKDAFVKADPANEAYYQANYDTYASKFDELDKKYKDTLSPLPNRSVVVAHEAFGYLCNAYGLNQMGIEGLSPDSEPDPARMAEVIDFVKENKVKTIFFEDLVSPKVAETIAKETGAKTEVLNPLEGLTDEQLKNGDDYFSVMEKNLTVLKEALE